MSKGQLIDALLTGKPYFGPVMRALQGPPVRHRYLTAIVRSLSRSKPQGDINILEIGSWAGASAVTWATSVNGVGRNGRITCVDLWQSYFDLSIEHDSHYKEMNEAAKENKVFNLFLHNIRAANVLGMIDYLMGNARDVLPNLQSEKFDIIYIDGSHAYEDVRSDIHNAKRLIRDGGIICGDDLELQKHSLDEREQQAAVVLGRDYVYSSHGQTSYHPGVTEAVASEFGNVATWEGVWAVRKVEKQWTTVELDLGEAEIPAHIANACTAMDVVEVGQTREFWLGRSDTIFLAVAKVLGATKLFVERLGERELPPVLFIGESLEEVQKKAVEVEHEVRMETELLGETANFNLVKSGEQFLAVAKRLGRTDLFKERLGERELPPFLFKGESLEDVSQMALKVDQEANVVAELVGQTDTFNLVKVNGRFLAVARRLGPAELFKERLGERELAPLLFAGESLEEVRQKAQTFERFTAGPEVELVDEIGSYNVVRAEDRFIAVAKALGPLHLFRERIGERDLPPLILLASDAVTLRQRIFEIDQR